MARERQRTSTTSKAALRTNKAGREKHRLKHILSLSLSLEKHGKRLDSSIFPPPQQEGSKRQERGVAEGVLQMAGGRRHRGTRAHSRRPSHPRFLPNP